METGTKEGLCFDLDFLGDWPRYLQSIHYAYVWRFQGTLERGCLSIKNTRLHKMVTGPIIGRNNFQKRFGHYTDQNTPFKS